MTSQITIYRCMSQTIAEVEPLIVEMNKELTEQCSWIHLSEYNSFAVTNVSDSFHEGMLEILGALVDVDTSELRETPSALDFTDTPIYDDETGEFLGTEPVFEIIKLWVQA